MGYLATVSLELKNPPIDEVVCGFVFAQASDVDTVLIGRYWSTRLDEFRTHLVQEPVGDEPALLFGPGLGRVWLVSHDDAWIVQVQPDRMFLNWRLRPTHTYPGFSTIAARGLAELARWRDFVETTAGVRPELQRIEVAKIDVLQQGRDWADRGDLAALLPIIAGSLEHVTGDDGRITIRLVDGDTSVAIDTVRMRTDAAHRAVRLETRCKSSARPADPGATLMSANVTLNDWFSRLVPDASRRFA